MQNNLLNQIIVCPTCKTYLDSSLTPEAFSCATCNSRFSKSNQLWDFTPQQEEAVSPIWKTWQQVQNNGLISYQADPSNNLSVGERNDSRMFADFCKYHGLVLDVGCGPQSCPAYFDLSAAEFVGIDPLADCASTEFLKIKALAEYLPFREQTFDHVLFSTTLDHFAEPLLALKEAARICRLDGEIDVWFGEKSPDAPKPAVSPEWYKQLQKPELADDVFHIKRLNAVEVQDLIERAGLITVESVAHKVDEYRVNYFYRLKARQGK